MQLGACFAGLAIENSMLGAAHALANPLTTTYGILHGEAIALVLPHVIRFNSQVAGSLYDDLAEEAGLLNGTPDLAAESLVGRITALMRLAKFPTTLSQCGVSSGILPVLAEEAAQQWTARFNPRPVSETDLQSLYEAAL